MVAGLSERSQMILLIGDNPLALEQTRLLLQETASSSEVLVVDCRTTLSFLAQRPISLIILDMTSSDTAELLQCIRRDYPTIPVIVETSNEDVEFAVNCMKAGVIDYLVRPVDPCKMVLAVENALNLNYSLQEVSSLKDYLLDDRLEHAADFAQIKTACRKMRSIFQYTEIVARSPHPVLITGETGVGKELFAHAIHRISKAKGPFVSINVAGLDDSMFSDTLFGHKKGAFTGADQYRDGLVRKAAMGTLFLDEIGDLNELSQVKLLRLLQEREYYPVGADQVKSSSARIVLATNVNLHDRILEGRFRRDLYYRLSTHQIHIPALRERREDIPLLLETFMKASAQHFGKDVPAVSPELLRALAAYDFPGNIRELQARVDDAIARHEEGILSLDYFPGISAVAQVHTTALSEVSTDDTAGIYKLFGRLPTFREIEDYLIMEALKLSEGNYIVAASILGVTRQTISNRHKQIRSASGI